MIPVTFRAANDPKKKALVRVMVPADLFTLKELREAGNLSTVAYGAIAEPRAFASYPTTPAGALGLMILSKSCPAGGPEEDAIAGMVGTVSFIRQARRKFEGKLVPSKLVAASIEFYKIKYGPMVTTYIGERLASESGEWRERIGQIVKDAARKQ